MNKIEDIRQRIAERIGIKLPDERLNQKTELKELGQEDRLRISLGSKCDN